jgi:multidrug/hemolysin transport system ATP-binding protein
MIAARGTPGELKTKYAADSLRLSVNDLNPVLQVLRELSLEFDISSSELIVKLPDTIAAVPVLERCKKYIKSFQVLQGTMDDAFIGITGKELRQ